MLDKLLLPLKRAVFHATRDAAEAGLLSALRAGSGGPDLSVEQAAAAYRALFAAPPEGEGPADAEPPGLTPTPAATPAASLPARAASRVALSSPVILARAFPV